MFRVQRSCSCSAQRLDSSVRAEAMDLSRNCPEELTPLNMRLWETQCDSALGKSTGALPIAGDADVLRSRG